MGPLGRQLCVSLREVESSGAMKRPVLCLLFRVMAGRLKKSCSSVHVTCSVMSESHRLTTVIHSLTHPGTSLTYIGGAREGGREGREGENEAISQGRKERDTLLETKGSKNGYSAVPISEPFEEPILVPVKTLLVPGRTLLGSMYNILW